MLALPLAEASGQALSVANTIAFMWLGLTVLLNAERRTWGTWVAGGGLVVGGLFFAAHAALYGSGMADLRGEVVLLWSPTLLPVLLPYFWYLVIAWYTGVIHSKLHGALVAGA